MFYICVRVGVAHQGPSPHHMTWQVTGRHHPQMEHATVERQIQLQKGNSMGIREKGRRAWPGLRCAPPFNYKFFNKNLCHLARSSFIVFEIQRRDRRPLNFSHFAGYYGTREPHDVFKSWSSSEGPGAEELPPASDSFSRESQSNCKEMWK